MLIFTCSKPSYMQTLSPHSFHVPVMGIAFTLDSPLKVARFGITSALSIIEDNIIETMRKHYYQQHDEPYIPITPKDKDYRARRITDYLNLVNRNVQEQVERLRNSAFEKGSDLVKYFEMLPDNSRLKEKYLQMLNLTDAEKKKDLEEDLRQEVRPGAIEVNIMTKVDKDNYDRTGDILENGSDALEALKAYASSELENSAVIFSAGMNPRLYNYLESFSEFDATAPGEFRKKVVVKVSDYRSALIQGKYLAKKGIWVSEFRIESGLNCGGHAFATPGLLMGPILEEFRWKKQELTESMFEIYNQALENKGKPVFSVPHPVKVTVQGGIGTFEEAEFLKDHYKVDRTGWGTPFLLCPEATTVDDETLKLLQNAGEEDVILSKSSPLGVPFNYLKGTTAETERLDRIKRRKPGSPCTEKYLVSNTEFTQEPICTASRKYQELKLEQLKSSSLPEAEYQQQVRDLEAKECLCIGLSNAAAVAYDEPFLKKLTAVTICPGPNIANFSKVVGLQEMTDHIYGRTNLLSNNSRPHMFIKELDLYLDYLREEIRENPGADRKVLKNRKTFCKNLGEGIRYYRDLYQSESFSDDFIDALNRAEKELQHIVAQPVVAE